MTSNEEMQLTSELFFEGDCVTSVNSGNVVSHFKFKFPREDAHSRNDNCIMSDEDGDLLVNRNGYGQYGTIKIEHKASTTLKLVGLQVWRGALLLADYILHNRNAFKDKNVLELGSGVGLTSIVASLFAKEVIATDIEDGGILELIEKNIIDNKNLVKSKCSVLPLDFCNRDWSSPLAERINTVDIILAADVIYDNDLTEDFIKTLTKLLDSPKKRKVYVALEKRYVFTISELDTVAPCYEYFLEFLKSHWNKPPMSTWTMKCVTIDFNQYFEYERLKHLVLWEICNS